MKYRYCSISVELRSWSGNGGLFNRLDEYRIFFHTSNCKSVSSLYAYRARIIAEPRPDMNITVAAFTVSEKSINNMTNYLRA